MPASLIAFSKGFYGALGEGESIERAFILGCNQIQIEIYGNDEPERKLVPVYSPEERKVIDLDEHEVLKILIKQPLNEIKKPAKIASSARSKSEKILLQQVGAEIASRLRQSLHNQIFINIEKEDQTKQVKRPWDYEVKVGNQANEKLDPNVTIIDVFERRDIKGRLLILGKPGSGKTTTMLDLARELLERSQHPNESIPVLVNLSSWASKQQSIPEWLVEELKTKYGVRSDIGKKWLQEQKLLPLLDGLDEVRSDRQRACVEALNQWISGNAGDSSPGQFVVCSRIEEYEQLETQLQMNGAICLTELSSGQIQGYLESVRRSHLWSLVSHNQTLKDLLRAPLFLSLDAATLR